MLKPKLIGLAHAGGSAAALAPFVHHLPRALEIQALELPGRATRRREALIADRPALVKQLCAELAPSLRSSMRPYVLFGHSLGGTLAFELAHALHTRIGRAPSLLLVAATPAPSLPPKRFDTQRMSDAALVAELKRLGGTPAEVLDHPQLLELCLPIIRADFQLCEAASPRDLPPLPCPIHVFAGRYDKLTLEELSSWRHETQRELTLTWFEGGHFFVRTHLQQLCAAIAQRLADAELIPAAMQADTSIG